MTFGVGGVGVGSVSNNPVSCQAVSKAKDSIAKKTAMSENIVGTLHLVLS